MSVAGTCVRSFNEAVMSRADVYYCFKRLWLYTMNIFDNVWRKILFNCSNVLWSLLNCCSTVEAIWQKRWGLRNFIDHITLSFFWIVVEFLKIFQNVRHRKNIRFSILYESGPPEIRSNILFWSSTETQLPLGR